jgi:hypothetical protein
MHLTWRYYSNLLRGCKEEIGSAPPNPTAISENMNPGELMNFLKSFLIDALRTAYLLAKTAIEKSLWPYSKAQFGGKEWN